MINLEDWIDNNRESLDTNDPGQGHFDRFGWKLAAQNRMVRRQRTMMSVIRIAAVFLFVCAVASWLIYQANNRSLKDSSMIAKTRELQETEQFYSRQLQAQYEVLKNLKFPDEKLKTSILKDVSQNDDSFGKLQADLKADPGNEMTIEAMINYYQTKLEVLNNIISNLKQVLNHSESFKYGGRHETFV